MNILSVYAHSEPRSLTSSLKNIAISELLAQKHNILESDLYGMGFSALAERIDFTQLSGNHYNYMLEQKNTAKNGLLFSPDIMAEIEKLAQADIILFHTPIWWFSVPAILKGWFDRVLAMGVAWDGGKIYEKGLLRGKSAMLCVVAGGPKEYYSEGGKHKATMEQILHPIQHGTFAFCGLDVLEPYIVYNSLGMNPGQYQKTIDDYQVKISHIIDSPAYLSRYD